MEGLSLDMLSNEEVTNFFDKSNNETEEIQDTSEKTENTEETKDNTTEVDFSDLGLTSESVGSGNARGKETPASSDAGTQNNDLFFSIAKALRDEGVFPDLDDETLKGVKGASDFRKLFDDRVKLEFDERARRLEDALNGGATTDEMKAYNQSMNTLGILNNENFINTLSAEGDEGEKARRQIMLTDYINRGFSEERANKMIEKSIADGTDIEDAKEAYTACKNYFTRQVNDFQNMFNQRAEQARKENEAMATSIKDMVEKGDFFGGLKVDKVTRQKAYENITKPVVKLKDGRVLTELQKYQMEHPKEYAANMGILYTITNGFKDMEKIVKGKVKEGMKKGFAELESVINNTRRNSDGVLNLANDAFDDDRSNWELAL